MPSLIDAFPASRTEFFQELGAFPFASDRAGDLGDAWFCAEASALAYKRPEFIASLASALAAEGWALRAFDQEPTQAVLLVSVKSAVLAFRGTRIADFPDLLRKSPINLRDLMTDLSSLLAPCRAGGRVHVGFQAAYREFWKAVGTEIVAAVGGRPLFLTGHSLGAAMATIAARELEGVAALYSFGSPRVGDEEFRLGFERVGLPVFRFSHGYDIVTTVPFEEIGYRHVGELLHIVGAADDHRIARAPQPTLLQAYQHNLVSFPKNVRRILAQLTDWKSFKLEKLELPADALSDHAPWNYTTKLCAAAMEGRAMP